MTRVLLGLLGLSLSASAYAGSVTKRPEKLAVYDVGFINVSALKVQIKVKVARAEAGVDYGLVGDVRKLSPGEFYSFVYFAPLLVDECPDAALCPPGMKREGKTVTVSRTFTIPDLEGREVHGLLYAPDDAVVTVTPVP